MTRTTKYVALDVHQATTVATVRDQKGNDRLGLCGRGALSSECRQLIEDGLRFLNELVDDVGGRASSFTIPTPWPARRGHGRCPSTGL